MAEANRAGEVNISFKITIRRMQWVHIRFHTIENSVLLCGVSMRNHLWDMVTIYLLAHSCPMSVIFLLHHLLVELHIQME